MSYEVKAGVNITPVAFWPKKYTNPRAVGSGLHKMVFGVKYFKNDCNV
jgi:hypothetical protein